MKLMYLVSLLLIIVGVVFIASLFIGNYTASAIGVALVGLGASIVLADEGTTARTFVIMWTALIIIIAVQLCLNKTFCLKSMAQK